MVQKKKGWGGGSTLLNADVGMYYNLSTAAKESVLDCRDCGWSLSTCHLEEGERTLLGIQSQ